MIALIVFYYLFASGMGFIFSKAVSKVEREYDVNINLIILLLTNIPVFVICFLAKKSELTVLMIMLVNAFELSAATMDKKYKTVYDFIHLCAMLCFIPAFICLHKFPWEAFVLIGISFVCWLLKGYAYSDALSFGVMGLSLESLWLLINRASFSFNDILFYFLIAMLATFVIFIIIQLFRKNISLSGKTKEKTAFIPYIFAMTCLLPIIFFI